MVVAAAGSVTMLLLDPDAPAACVTTAVSALALLADWWDVDDADVDAGVDVDDEADVELTEMRAIAVGFFDKKMWSGVESTSASAPDRRGQ
jgi:hypothetical protein